MKSLRAFALGLYLSVMGSPEQYSDYASNFTVNVIK